MIRAVEEPLFKLSVFAQPLQPNEIASLNRFIHTARSNDPALIIQFHSDGLIDRVDNGFAANPQQQIIDYLVNHGLQQEAQSEIIFYHTSQAFVFQVLQAMVHDLPWCRHMEGHPDVAHAYIMLTERRRPDTSPLLFVFNQF